jgi:dUTP pyrophosphatase
MKRGFEKIKPIAILPIRSTTGSAGYDFSVIEKTIVPANGTVKINTYLKAYMQTNEFLSIHIRSSMGIKKGLYLLNQAGIVDSDYYNNPDNEGHIIIFVGNRTNEDVVIEAGERIAQGIFMSYLIADNDDATGERTGGFGSTN